MTVLLLLGAVVVGTLVQMYLSYQQQTSFNRMVTSLKKDGTVSVGAGGRRYRGGRAFVALAVDDHGIVRNALTLRGWTTFARGRPLPAVVNVKANKIRGESPVPGLAPAEREAARQAVTLLQNRRAAPA